jgi:hypothetical protein
LRRLLLAARAEAAQALPVQALEWLPEPEPEQAQARQRAAQLVMPAPVPPAEVMEAVAAAPAPQRSSIRKLPREAVAMRALRDS